MSNNCNEIKALSGAFPEDLVTMLEIAKPFRSKQIFKWIANGARTFEDMSNLPKEFQTYLNENFSVFSTHIEQTLKDPDGTVKLQISLHDGSAVETVLLTDSQGRKTACVSCQVGCPMNCAFCQTGHIGYTRNLCANEIVEQFFHLEDAVGKLDNIVFMGMGEPMLNLNAIRKSIAILTHIEGRALSRRRITISTSGICEGIHSLADDGPAVRLAVSLTTANDALRTTLMPVNNANPLQKLKEAISYFSEKMKKRVTLEVALMSGVNTSEKDAREIADFAKGLNVHINLIPWNPVDTLPFSTPKNSEIISFVKMLEGYHLNVTLRHRRGEKIGGACGQLGKSIPQVN